MEYTTLKELIEQYGTNIQVTKGPIPKAKAWQPDRYFVAERISNNKVYGTTFKRGIADPSIQLKPGEYYDATKPYWRLYKQLIVEPKKYETLESLIRQFGSNIQVTKEATPKIKAWEPDRYFVVEKIENGKAFGTTFKRGIAVPDIQNLDGYDIQYPYWKRYIPFHQTQAYRATVESTREEELQQSKQDLDMWKTKFFELQQKKSDDDIEIQTLRETIEELNSHIVELEQQKAEELEEKIGTEDEVPKEIPDELLAIAQKYPPEENRFFNHINMICKNAFAAATAICDSKDLEKMVDIIIGIRNIYTNTFEIVFGALLEEKEHHDCGEYLFDDNFDFRVRLRSICRVRDPQLLPILNNIEEFHELVNQCGHKNDLNNQRALRHFSKESKKDQNDKLLSVVQFFECMKFSPDELLKMEKIDRIV